MLLACCDGSYNPMELTASYGATFGTSDGPILRVAGPCPGHPSLFSAYRSELVSINAATELVSINAATYLILQLCVTERVTGGSFILYNDCSKA
jgi:hypothetical protein